MQQRTWRKSGRLREVYKPEVLQAFEGHLETAVDLPAGERFALAVIDALADRHVLPEAGAHELEAAYVFEARLTRVGRTETCKTRRVLRHGDVASRHIAGREVENVD